MVRAAGYQLSPHRRRRGPDFQSRSTHPILSPIGRPRVSLKIERKVRALGRRGYGFVKIGRQLHIGTRASQRIVSQR